jgi:hypothetical protein
MVDPVVSEGVETLIPPAAEVLTAPFKVAEVPAETFNVEAVMASVFKVVVAAKEVAPVVTTAPLRMAEVELLIVNAPA